MKQYVIQQSTNPTLFFHHHRNGYMLKEGSENAALFTLERANELISRTIIKNLVAVNKNDL